MSQVASMLTLVCRLELGAGSGLVGLAVAKGFLQKYGAGHAGDIHLTDQDVMIPLMHRNIALNTSLAEHVHASVLDWGSIPQSLPTPNVVLAADCVYFEPSFPLLQQTLEQLIGSKTVCYFCFKKRRRADLRFMKDVKKTFLVQEVDDDRDKTVWSRQGLFL